MEKNLKSNPVDFNVRIDRLLDGEGTTKAFASATIGGVFAVHDIRVVEKDDKLSIRMPFRSYKTGGETKYTDTCHPVTAEFRTALYDAIEEAYVQALENKMAETERSGMAMNQQM